MRKQHQPTFTAPLALLAALFLALPFFGQAAPNPAPAAIRHVIQESAAAWNRGDVNGFLASYENSPETTYIGAEGPVHGWQQIRQRYVKKYVTPDRGKMGVLRFSQLDIRLLGPRYAIAIGHWHLERTAANGGDVGGYFTLTFHKSAAGWRIIVDHTS
jgi:uncharacterized protein (TIGR02246 family)